MKTLHTSKIYVQAPFSLASKTPFIGLRGVTFRYLDSDTSLSAIKARARRKRRQSKTSVN